MSKDKDIAPILAGWPNDPGTVRARTITGPDGKMFIQLRVELGVLQMAEDGRPDGERPEGCESLLESLRLRGSRELSDTQQRDLVREMLQFYRRRIGFMALARQARAAHDLEQAEGAYRRAIRDADHNLAILDLLSEHGVGLEMVGEHEQYRPFILMHRAACRAEQSLLVHDPDQAIEQLKTGIAEVESASEQAGLPKRPFTHELRRMERLIRRRYRRRRTLPEQLEDAIAAENYEQAAKLRDVLRRREGPEQ